MNGCDEICVCSATSRLSISMMIMVMDIVLLVFLSSAVPTSIASVMSLSALQSVFQRSWSRNVSAPKCAENFGAITASRIADNLSAREPAPISVVVTIIGSETTTELDSIIKGWDGIGWDEEGGLVERRREGGLEE